MRRRRSPAVITVQFKRHAAVLHGPVRVVHPALRAFGCPWQYDHRAHTYLAPLQRLDDVIADSETRGHVVVEGAR